MRRQAAVVIVLCVALAPWRGAAQDELLRVRELYALASYEEAIATLDAAASRLSVEKAAQYRALCLIGLGRTAEAEQTLERLALAQPAYDMPADEVSPRLVNLFRETRLRAIPSTARARYAEARAAYDRKQFAQAVRAFREVQALLVDDTLVARIEGLGDLKQLSDGFLGLAEAELVRDSSTVAAAPLPAPSPLQPIAAATASRATAATEASPTASRAAAGTVDPAATPAPVAEPAIYSDADADVRPPQDQVRRLPAWHPPGPLARTEFSGILEVVVSETGQVEAASIVRSVHPLYDGSLREAARQWRFRPALKGDVAVRYRKRIEVVLNRR
jgi:TonB family protein